MYGKKPQLAWQLNFTLKILSWLMWHKFPPPLAYPRQCNVQIRNCATGFWTGLGAMATVQEGTSSSLEKPGHHSKLDEVVNCDYLAFLPWGGRGGGKLITTNTSCAKGIWPYPKVVTIQKISFNKTCCAIHRLQIYPVDSVIHHSNHWSEITKCNRDPTQESCSNWVYKLYSRNT